MFNTFRPDDAYVCQCTVTIVQVMAFKSLTANLLSINQLGLNFSEIILKYKHLLSWKCNRKCPLQAGIYFVKALFY